MSTGPITIFDKSALQALSLDEAVLFGQFYRVNLTPVFFVETLADLEKRVREGQSPEQVVGHIARKTAGLTADPCAHHFKLVLSDLLGDAIPMNGQTPVEGGRPVQSGDRQGVVYETSREARALSRWQEGRFVEVEREIAREWREGLQQQKLRRLDLAKLDPSGPLPRTLLEVRRKAETFVWLRRHGFVTALDVLEVPSPYRAPILERWLRLGSPPVATFAPYAAYVATVKMFFHLAVSLGLLSDERPSTAADIAYLFYLPFCMVFTSDDKLHAKTVPLFMRTDQVFVRGAELKADLRRLDAHFSAQPPEVLERGVMYFELPFDSDYLTTSLWRRFLPGWSPDGRSDVKMDPEKEKELLEMIKQAGKAPAIPGVSGDDPDFLIIKRWVPEKLGKWRILSAETAARSRAAQEE